LAGHPDRFGGPLSRAKALPVEVNGEQTSYVAHHQAPHLTFTPPQKQHKPLKRCLNSIGFQEKTM